MTYRDHLMIPSNIEINNWESDLLNDDLQVETILIRAYQAGADAELDRCCEWLDFRHCASTARELRAQRRPSLKQLALEQLDSFLGLLNSKGLRSDVVRAALEALPND